MAFKRRPVFNRGRGPERQTQWFTIDFAATAVDNSAVLVSSFNAPALELRPFTIVRTHLEVRFATDQQVASEDIAGAVGMCVVNQAAQTQGVGSVPTPITESGADVWYLHQWMISGVAFSAGGFFALDGITFSLDSKAMRKVNNDETSILVVEGASQGEGSIISVAGRQLIKLH